MSLKCYHDCEENEIKQRAYFWLIISFVRLSELLGLVEGWNFGVVERLSELDWLIMMQHTIK